MRTIKIIALLILSLNVYAQSQTKTTTSDQSRTIEINNENGELYISFLNGVITEFVVNDTPITQERYGDYQEIIDDFSQEEEPTPPVPSSPVPPSSNDDQAGELRTMIVDYLVDNKIIDSHIKYNVLLEQDILKVDRKKMSHEVHETCLDYFAQVYGHRLNRKTKVKFKKSKRKSSSSVSISK